MRKDLKSIAYFFFHSISDVRLTNGLVESSGRLEVRYSGIWGTVCMDGFKDTHADIVCKSLGYK